MSEEIIMCVRGKRSLKRKRRENKEETDSERMSARLYNMQQGWYEERVKYDVDAFLFEKTAVFIINVSLTLFR